ncbi:MAG: carbon storage regulator [Pirellulales bacterium]|nr:carbon storage regulator [Pirellulales bacterium]
MLVVTRKVGEGLVIGDSVSVTVLKITAAGVRLGIEASPETPIMREELAEELRLADEQRLTDSQP